MSLPRNRSSVKNSMPVALILRAGFLFKPERCTAPVLCTGPVPWVLILIILLGVILNCLVYCETKYQVPFSAALAISVGLIVLNWNLHRSASIARPQADISGLGGHSGGNSGYRGYCQSNNRSSTKSYIPFSGVYLQHCAFDFIGCFIGCFRNFWANIRICSVDVNYIQVPVETSY